MCVEYHFKTWSKTPRQPDPYKFFVKFVSYNKSCSMSVVGLFNIRLDEVFNPPIKLEARILSLSSQSIAYKLHIVIFASTIVLTKK